MLLTPVEMTVKSSVSTGHAPAAPETSVIIDERRFTTSRRCDQWWTGNAGDSLMHCKRQADHQDLSEGRSRRLQARRVTLGRESSELSL